MKVNGGGNSDSIRRREFHDQDAVRINTSGGRPSRNARAQIAAGKNAGPQPQIDTVDIRLGQAINAELSSDTVDGERTKRVAELKALVAAGQYNPPIDAVAESVGREIVLEILSGSDIQLGGE